MSRNAPGLGDYEGSYNFGHPLDPRNDFDFDNCDDCDCEEGKEVYYGEEDTDVEGQ